MLFISDLGSLKNKDVKGNLYAQHMLILTLLSAVSLLWSPNKTDAYFQIGVLSVLIINSFLIYYFVKRYHLLDFIVFFTLCVSFINQIASLRIPIFNFLLYNTTERGGADGVIMGWGWKNRFSGMMENPNSLAIFLLFSLYLSFFKLNNMAKGASLKSAIHFVNILLGFYTLFLTQSRKGIVFGLMLAGLFVFLKFTVKKAIFFVGFLSLAIAAIAFIPTLQEIVINSFARVGRASDTLQGTDAESSSVHRLYFAIEGWEGFKEKPIFGHGINSFRHYFGLYSHNNFIEILFGLGAVGFIIYYQIHWKIIHSLKNVRGSSSILLFVGIIVLMDVGYVSYESKINMLVLTSLLAQRDELLKKPVLRKIRSLK